jgi:uncharacterized protein (DUF2141 family)
VPDSVAAANPTLVMPWSTARSFQSTRTLALDQNRYNDGTIQSRVLVDSSRRSWAISQRLTATQLDDLRTFFNSVVGQCTEFWFYDVYETSPIFSYDDTGTATTGRYAVRFNGPLRYSLDWGRNPCEFSLIEVS